LAEHLGCGAQDVYLIRLMLFIQENNCPTDINTNNKNIVEIANKITLTINETGTLDDFLATNRDISKNTIAANNSDDNVKEMDNNEDTISMIDASEEDIHENDQQIN